MLCNNNNINIIGNSAFFVRLEYYISTMDKRIINLYVQRPGWYRKSEFKIASGIVSIAAS